MVSAKEKRKTKSKKQNRKAEYEMSQGQREGGSYRGVAKNIPREKSCSSLKEVGANLADEWERAFQAWETSVQMSCSRAWLGCWGTSRRSMWLEPNVHRERGKK